MKSEIYGDDINSEKPIAGERLSYFYLHGQAERKNGFDCCNGNIEAFANAIRNLLFFADITYVNGEKEECLVVPYPYCGAINGRIVLPNDLDALKHAMAHRNNQFSMYEHEKERMKKEYPETFNFIKQLDK